MKNKINDIVTYITMVAGFMTVIAGIVTITWFIQDNRKENSKVLKRQEQILIKIEEGQRKGFEMLEKSQRKGFEMLEKSQRQGFESLQKSLEIQTKILERIEAK